MRYFLFSHFEKGRMRIRDCENAYYSVMFQFVTLILFCSLSPYKNNRIYIKRMLGSYLKFSIDYLRASATALSWQYTIIHDFV